MRLHCKEHRYMDEKTGPTAECPYCEIDRLKQYEDAITNATKGKILVWNLVEANCTVVEHTYWLAHLEKIEKLEKALKKIADSYSDLGAGMKRTAKEALEI